MECPVCCNNWDLQEVRPKGLPCQHSLCQSCLGRLQSRACPQCRKAFVEPVPDNFTLVGVLEALDLERPRGSWWCTECKFPATAQCVEDHSVRRPKAALRLGVQDVLPRASQALQGLQDGLQGLQDGAALTALRLLRGPPAFCRLTLRQDDGAAFGAEWRVDGQGAEDSLLQTLVVALAASGRLLQDPSGVHVDAPPAAQQPAEDLIAELDLDELSQSDPAARREDKAETLRLVRQRGVRRMIWVHGDSDPDWVLEVLRSAAPTLEELEVFHASDAHVAAVHGMPRLQRLDLHASSELRPEELPALPRPTCLRWLAVNGLPRATAVSLLRAHAASLDELWLEVGSEPGGEWPRGFGDLDTLLGQCRMWLTRLVLIRDGGGSSPCVAECFDQLEAARRVLPGCTVECDQCDGGELNGDFWSRVTSR